MPMDTSLQPGQRQPAPGALRLVQAFVNTADLEAGSDELADPEALRAWLARHDVPGGDATPSSDELRLALETREALRALLVANHGEPVDPAAIQTLDRVGRQAGLRVRFDLEGRARLVPAAAGVAAALGALLAVVYAATVDGTWPRLKACRRDVCRWAYYDTSKNRSGAWCAMAICGNRTTVRAYRRRHAARA
jgi:predicted RNA-binding Zn ribbon-like protein